MSLKEKTNIEKRTPKENALILAAQEAEKKGLPIAGLAFKNMNKSEQAAFLRL